jgi:hypothetical protein
MRERYKAGGFVPPPEPDHIREGLGFEVGARVWMDRFGEDDAYEGIFRRVIWHVESGPLAIEFGDGFMIPWHAVKGYYCHRTTDGTNSDGTVGS